MGKFPPGARGETYLESVTSALIRASGVLRLPPAAILYVRNCPVAALCQEESGSSRILDSPSARAKDDCFVGLCLQVGPCDGRELPRGGFRGPEGGRSYSSSCLHSSRRFSISLSVTATKESPVSGPGGVQHRQQRCTTQPLLMLCS